MLIEPFITIISPCFNHEKYVIQSLESIKNQTYKNIQHIIIDDCSSDNSVSLIEEWISLNNYTCTFIKHNINKGLSHSLNESIDLATGEFWTALATDDIAHISRTEIMLENFTANPKLDVVISDTSYIDDNGNPIDVIGFNSFTQLQQSFRTDIDLSQYGDFQSLMKGNYVPSSALYRTESIKAVGKYDTTLRVEDWDMLLQLCKRNHFKYVDEKLTYYRWHDQNTMKTMTPAIIRDFVFILIKNQAYGLQHHKIEFKKCFKERLKNHFYHNFLQDAYKILFRSKLKTIVLLEFTTAIFQRIIDKTKKLTRNFGK